MTTSAPRLAASLCEPPASTASRVPARTRRGAPPRAGFGAAVPTARSAAVLDKHVPIDRYADGLRQLHASPDVFVVDDFLSADACADIIARAKA